jgi:gluconokinase
VTLVFLDASPELIRKRLARRRDHFFDPSLLESQFSALERPSGALVLSAGAPVPELVERIVRHLEGS